MVYISQLAPIGKPIVVTADPLNGLFLKQAIVLSGSLLDAAKVYHCLMPGLSQNCNCQISFGAKVRLMSSYLGAVREAFESHRAIIAQGNGFSGKKLCSPASLAALTSQDPARMPPLNPPRQVIDLPQLREYSLSYE